jgi:hypothetical protein
MNIAINFAELSHADSIIHESMTPVSIYVSPVSIYE